MMQEVYDLSDLVEDPIPPDHEFDELILSTVADQMAMSGYTRVDVAAGDPDVVVMVGAVAQQDWAYYSWSGCWGYPGYWCYHPPYAVPVAYEVGTLLNDARSRRSRRSLLDLSVGTRRVRCCGSLR